MYCLDLMRIDRLGQAHERLRHVGGRVGIAAGEQVATSGSFKLRDGAKVQVKAQDTIAATVDARNEGGQ